MKLNNKGFSLIEILAVVVILAIVSTVGIVSITSMINKSKDNYYVSQNENFVMAARAYVNDNRDRLPKNIGGSNRIKLDELLKSNYLKEEIKDQDKKPCDPSKSYVKVLKKNQNDYRYIGYLNCPACDKKKKAGEVKDGYCITDIESIPEASIALNVGSLIIDGKSEEQIKMAKGTLTMKGDSSLSRELYSYSYKVYRDGSLSYNSGVKRIKGQTKSINIDDRLAEYVPGKLKVVLTVTNEDGFSKTVSSSRNYNDVVKPHCGTVTGESKTKVENGIRMCEDSEWTREPKRIFIVCNDYQGTGCKLLESAKYFTEDSQEYGKDTIEIEDVSNHSDTCYVYPCIDRTTPKLVVSVSATGFSQTYTVEGQTEEIEYSTGNDISQWLRSSVIINVVATDPTSRIKSFSWYQNDPLSREEDIGDATNVIDNNRNVNNKTYSKSLTLSSNGSDDGVRKELITVEDYAGNITNYELILRIDNVKPTCEVDDYDDECKQSGLSLYVNCKDDISGVNTCANVSGGGELESSVEKTGVKSTTTYTVTDSAGNSNTCSTKSIVVDSKFRKRTCASGPYCTWGCCKSCNSSCTGYVYDGTEKKCDKDGKNCVDVPKYKAVTYHGCNSCGCDTWYGDAKRIDIAKSCASWNSWTDWTWADINKLSCGSNPSYKCQLEEQKYYRLSSSKKCSKGTPTPNTKTCKKDKKLKNSMTRCGKKASVSVYKWTYESKSCGGSKKYRKYKFKQYACQCYYVTNKGKSSFCSSDYFDVTSCYHGDNYAYIRYKNSSNGESACNANKPINSYVEEVCNSDDYKSTRGSVFYYHGYRFFEGGNVGNWNGLNAGWTHGYEKKSLNRPADSASVTKACDYACKQRYGD